MKVHGIGRLGRDPETRYSSEGKAVTSFSVAFDEGYGDRKHTCWIRCNAFGKQAEIIAEHVSKGQRIYIDGRLDIREFEKDGQKRLSTEVQIESFEFVEAKADKPKEEKKEEKRGGVAAMDDDLPFAARSARNHAE